MPVLVPGVLPTSSLKQLLGGFVARLRAHDHVGPVHEPDPADADVGLIGGVILTVQTSRSRVALVVLERENFFRALRPLRLLPRGPLRLPQPGWLFESVFAFLLVPQLR